MSADNMICIQKRLNGLWCVWMDFASNDDKCPDCNGVSFGTLMEANRYASGWLRGESIVEYGIVGLEPQQVDPMSNEEKKEGLIDDLVYIVDDMGYNLTIERVKRARGILKELKGLVEDESD